MAAGTPDEPNDSNDGHHDADDYGLVGNDDERREPLPRDDRVWIHPSELARPTATNAPSNSRSTRTVLVAAGLAAGFVAGAVANPFRDLGDTSSPAFQRTTDTTLTTPVAGTYISAVDRTSPAVVQIVVNGSAEAIGLSDDLSASSTATSVGSGVVMHDDGYIVTSARLVSSGTTISVLTADGSTYQAELVGTDLETDIGVLRVNDVELTPPTFASSHESQVGDGLVAVSASTSGARRVSWSVGAIQRTGVWLVPLDSEPMVGLLATDIPLASGMAGAIVADIEGDVIGMIMPVASSPFTPGVGAFVVPSQLLVTVSNSIITTGSSGRAWLGVVTTSTTSGLVVTKVFPGSPAEASGILVGEVLLTFNDTPVSTPLALMTAVRTTPYDTQVRINGVGSGQPVLHLTRLSTSPSTSWSLDDSEDQADDDVSDVDDE